MMTRIIDTKGPACMHAHTRRTAHKPRADPGVAEGRDVSQFTGTNDALTEPNMLIFRGFYLRRDGPRCRLPFGRDRNAVIARAEARSSEPLYLHLARG